MIYNSKWGRHYIKITT